MIKLIAAQERKAYREWTSLNTLRCKLVEQEEARTGRKVDLGGEDLWDVVTKSTDLADVAIPQAQEPPTRLSVVPLPENIWEEHRFEVQSSLAGKAKLMGEEVLAQPQAFKDWAVLQDATLDNKYEPNFMPADWRKESIRHIGAIRHHPKNKEFRGTCEFWSPLGDMAVSIYHRTGKTLDRSDLLEWALQVLAVENQSLTDIFCFSVLKVECQGKSLYFYRSNEAMSAYQLYSSPAWQEERKAKRDQYGKGKWKDGPAGSYGRGYADDQASEAGGNAGQCEGDAWQSYKPHWGQGRKDR